MHIAILCASPRRDGNSRLLAQAVADGAREAGHTVDLVDLHAELGGFIRDCRTCRDADGRCTIDDGYEDVLLKRALPADGWVFATPLYWYSVSAQLKAFFDRISCYIAGSYPESDDVIAALKGKRYGVVISSEETYPGGALGLLHTVQEYVRYARGELVGVVRGIGNQRGDVLQDPEDPLAAARALGARLLESHYSDYRVDTDRAGSVWEPVRA